MDNNYFGEPSSGERGSSSRKGKKNNNSDKPKQPQRGMGVAQLEKIRLQNQMGYCSYPPSLHNPYHSHLNQEGQARMGTTYASGPSSFTYSSSSAPLVCFRPNIMMSRGETEAADFRYGDDSQSSVTTRRSNSISYSENQYSMHHTETRHQMSVNVEDSLQKKRRNDRCASIGSSSQNSDSSDTMELDLELRL